MERRALLQWMIATGGAAVFNTLGPRDLEALGADVHRLVDSTRSHAQSRAMRTLGAQAAATVAAAAERIIPATDTPGATDAGVTAFIDVMLSDWYPAADRTRFLAGLETLDVRSRSRTGRPFSASAVSDQDVLLEEIDREVSTLRASSADAANNHWFGMLKYLTVWGYCTSEPGMRKTLRSWPLPMRYDGAAPVTTR